MSLMLFPVEQKPHPDPLRVVDIINLSSSADSLLKNRVSLLRREGIDNRIICMDGPFVPKLQSLGIPVYTVPLPRGYDPVKLLFSMVRMVVYLRRERIDIVHTHCSIPGIIGRIAAWMAGVPIIIHTVHGFHFHDRTPRLKRAFYMAIERFAGFFTHTLLSQNRHDLEVAASHGFVPRSRLQYIGNGIKLDDFPMPDRSAVHRDNLTITCIARLEPIKNHKMLFEAAGVLKTRGHRFRLLLVGDGELRGRYQTLCKKLGIEDRVEFLGYRNDVPEILAMTDLSVLTSVKEGVPRAIIESMAMGIPVVATRVSGNREAVRHGESGFLVELDDVASFADTLERLITDPDLRTRIGTRARTIAEQEYDESSIVESLHRVYAKSVAGRFEGGIPSMAAEKAK